MLDVMSLHTFVDNPWLNVQSWDVNDWECVKTCHSLIKLNLTLTIMLAFGSVVKIMASTTEWTIVELQESLVGLE